MQEFDTEYSKHPNSHQEKCKKYKRQIEELKLDKAELEDALAGLQAEVKKLRLIINKGK